jgi:hypothetical protein
MQVTDEHIVNLASRMFGVSPDTIKRYRTMSKIDLGNITLLDVERNIKMKSTLKILERVIKIEKLKNKL